MAMGEFSAYSSQRRTQRSSLQLGLYRRRLYLAITDWDKKDKTAFV